MQFRIDPAQSFGTSAFFKCFPLLAALCLAAAFAAAQSTVPSGGQLRTDKASEPNAINQPPDANVQMEMRERQASPLNFAEANAARKKQIAEDSARLLKLAADLKTEVDKTAQDTLSLNVIRKAAEIEALAHSVKEKMKLTLGAY